MSDNQTPWFTRCAMVTMLAACAAGAARADVEDVSSGVVADTHVERSDATGLALRSAPGVRTDLTELSAQRWLHSGRASVGVGAGSVTLVERSNGLLPGRTGDGATMPQAAGTTLMLGLRYRATPQSSLYADTMHVRGLGLNGESQVVGKVGVEFKAAQSDWNIGYGGLGMRLAGDARMTLKVRRGGLMVSMRRSF